MRHQLINGVILGILVISGISVKAQEEKGVRFNVSGDFVSSYVWRGAYDGGASVQPTLGVEIGNLSFAAWGSKEICGPGKEVDLTLTYAWRQFEFFVSDCWSDGEKYGNENAEHSNNKFFHFNNHETGHHAEAGLAYTISEKLPLTIGWYTIFWGQDKKENGKQNYSSYVELNYAFSVKGVDLEAFVGASPYQSEFYDINGFGVINLGLSATKEIRLSKSFSLPLFTQLIFDPAHEDAHLVLGFTLR